MHGRVCATFARVCAVASRPPLSPSAVVLCLYPEQLKGNYRMAASWCPQDSELKTQPTTTHFKLVPCLSEYGYNSPKNYIQFSIYSFDPGQNCHTVFLPQRTLGLELSQLDSKSAQCSSGPQDRAHSLFNAICDTSTRRCSTGMEETSTCGSLQEKIGSSAVAKCFVTWLLDGLA